MAGVRPEAEVAKEGVGGAVDGLATPAGMAGSARHTRVDVDPIPDLQLVNLASDGGDLTSRIQSIDGRKGRKREKRKPLCIVSDHIFHVRDHAAGPHAYKHVGG